MKAYEGLKDWVRIRKGQWNSRLRMHVMGERRKR